MMEQMVTLGTACGGAVEEPEMNKAMMSSATDEWLTPNEILDALGTFDLDPCAHPLHRTRCAKKGYCLPEEDGRMLPWKGRVWCNPPYGREIGKWVERMAAHDNGIMLVPARTDTRWFRTIWLKSSAILFFCGRVEFLRPDLTPGDSPAFPSVLVSFGYDCEDELVAACENGKFNGQIITAKREQ